MAPPPLRFVCDGLPDGLGAPPAGFECVPDDAEPAAEARVLLPATATAARALAAQADLARHAFAQAVLVRLPAADPTLEDELLRLGVEAVVQDGEDCWRALRHAVERKRVERSARTAYATDLATGLPHEAQLLEHLGQLIALREREPAPMALIALQVDGFAQAATRLGGEAANVLRRKVAVRLRAGLRAADVVAAIGPQTFGVLLGRLELASDGERVAAKLARALQQPLVVAGQPCAVATAVGLALYPQHGKDAAALLRRACAQAGSSELGGGPGRPASAPPAETAGTAGIAARGRSAANDEA